MVVTKTIVRRDGSRVLTVNVGPAETLVSNDSRFHYKLGGQVDDVVASHVITEAEPVYWCSIEQRWL